MSAAPQISTQSRQIAIAAVVVSSLAWAFWWFPVRLIETTGATGAWTGALMSVTALIFCLPLLIIFPGRISSRAVLGTVIVGAAVILYTISVTFTDFVRAVLIFYIAPAWSVMIECAFLGRRWTLRALLSIAAAFAGLAFISRGEISFEGVGALGDWMAFIAGIAWSVGAALLFTARRADFGWTMVLTLLGAVGVAGGLLAILGNDMGAAPSAALWEADGLLACTFGGVYLGFILGCTMWAATRLPPATMSFLLSIEVVAGVAVSALILGEPFGWFEFAGSVCIVGAVLLELFAPAQTSQS